MPHPALHIDRLVKRYASGTLAVDGVSVTVPEGEFFGLLGSNGAGKTTTISCITGTAVPTGGTIEVFGHNAVSHYKESRALIGLSPQEFNVDIFAKVEDILDYIGGYFGMPKNTRKARVDELIRQFDLEKYRRSKFMELSGGYKRRVVIARALMHDPKLLILDEPTAGVDVETRRDLWKYLEDLNKAGKTIILTSHYIEEVERLCSRVAIIQGGQIVAEGQVKDLTSDGCKLEDVYLSVVDEHKAKQQTA